MPDLAGAGIEEVTAVDCQGWWPSPFSRSHRLANRATFSYRGPEVVRC